MGPGLIQRYRAFLPVTDRTPVVSLGEGNTPLLRARALEAWLGCRAEVYLKVEGANPSGSFKDRGMTVALSKAVEEGARAVICASTGNTSASAAAYAAASGCAAYVLVPQGKIALGKLSQAVAHGATVLQVQGNFDDALKLVKEVAATHPVALVNSINPYRIEGQKTGAFEVCDQLTDAPDLLCIPVGNAGNITAYWRGFQEYRAAGRTRRVPRMLGWQAEGAAPLVLGHPVKDPETIASAIRIGNPASWQSAVAAAEESGGAIGAVSDAEILEAYAEIPRREGIFCEPASAAAVAGLRKLHREEGLPPGSRIVCVLTGHGLKDADRALTLAPRPASVLPTLEAVAAALGLP
ncbi:MAG: threonine synthase [Candidatus Methylomirabilales bacterium]